MPGFATHPHIAFVTFRPVRLRNKVSPTMNVLNRAPFMQNRDAPSDVMAVNRCEHFGFSSSQGPFLGPRSSALLKKLQNMRIDDIRLKERCHMRCAFDNFLPGPRHGLRELISVLALYAIELSCHDKRRSFDRT